MSQFTVRLLGNHYEQSCLIRSDKACLNINSYCKLSWIKNNLPTSLIIPARFSDTIQSDTVLLNPLIGKIYNLNENALVHVEFLDHPILFCTSVELLPESLSDWLIIQKNASIVEFIFWEQIKVLNYNTILPLRLPNGSVVHFRIGKIQPESPTALINVNTILLIAPFQSESTISSEKIQIHNPTPELKLFNNIIHSKVPSSILIYTEGEDNNSGSLLKSLLPEESLFFNCIDSFVRLGLLQTWKSLKSLFDNSLSDSNPSNTYICIQDIEVFWSNEWKNNLSYPSPHESFLESVCSQLARYFDILLKSNYFVIITAKSKVSLENFSKFDSYFTIPDYEFQISELFSTPDKLQFIRQFSQNEALLQKCLEKKLNISKIQYLLQSSTSNALLHWEQRKLHIIPHVEIAFEDHILLPILFKSVYETSPIKLSHSLFLYGSPGVGKTFMIDSFLQFIKNTLPNVAIMRIRGPELLGKYIGSSEESVRKTFESARKQSPCILFFDEFEALVPRRGSDAASSGVSDRIVNQFLSELDGIDSSLLNSSVYILAASNRPEKIDSAILRPGRLDQHLYLQLPDYEARLKFLKYAAIKQSIQNISLEDIPSVTAGDNVLISWPYIAAKTEGFTFSDLEALILCATLRAFDDGTQVSGDHFLYALRTTMPSLSDVDLQSYKNSFHEFKHGVPIHPDTKAIFSV